MHLNRGIYSPRGLTGYHFVIRRDGRVEIGRDLLAQGAHAYGWNDVSIGICLVGGARKVEEGEEPEWADMVAEDNFTAAQCFTLHALLRTTLRIWNGMMVVPHSAVSVKACPSFDVWEWSLNWLGFSDETRFAEYKTKREQAKGQL